MQMLTIFINYFDDGLEAHKSNFPDNTERDGKESMQMEALENKVTLIQ